MVDLTTEHITSSSTNSTSSTEVVLKRANTEKSQHRTEPTPKRPRTMEDKRPRTMEDKKRELVELQMEQIKEKHLIYMQVMKKLNKYMDEKLLEGSGTSTAIDTDYSVLNMDFISKSMNVVNDIDSNSI